MDSKPGGRLWVAASYRSHMRFKLVLQFGDGLLFETRFVLRLSQLVLELSDEYSTLFAVRIHRALHTTLALLQVLPPATHTNA
jgi:hypothetical protein